MSAYAALVSLLQIVGTLINSGGQRMNHMRPQLRSLREKVIFLLDFLDNSSTCSAGQKPALETKMREAAYKVQDFLECHLSRSVDNNTINLKAISFRLYFGCGVLISYFRSRLVPDNTTTIHIGVMLRTFEAILWAVSIYIVFDMLPYLVRNWIHILDLRPLLNDLNIIVNEINVPRDSDLPAASSRQDFGETGKNVVVGLESDLEKIRNHLTPQYSSKRKIVSIVGMGGIGKTTLARLVYHDPYIVEQFRIRAWVTVSQEYSLRNVLLCLLKSADMFTKEMQEYDENKLGLYLYRSLMGRSYLIVMDDVWDTKIWDSIRVFFPPNDNGSRVLLTSRLLHVARYPDSSGPIHQMRCLNEDDSWYLLREKVFGGESCPLELESIGREIARNCRGLPLSIVVIGGLLCKDNRREIWRDVAENMNSRLRQTEEECLEILGLSYKHLPHHLRPCFLYMGAFQEDCEIPVSKLIRLWVAEGFLKPRPSRSLEEVAEDYLEDLIDRNLIFVGKRSCNGKIRTCSIHDLLRDICVQNAEKENFFLVVDEYGTPERPRGPAPAPDPRRLSIRHKAQQVSARNHLESYSYFSSYLYTSIKNSGRLYINFGCLYIRVLDLLTYFLVQFPNTITQLDHLRYVALQFPGSFPPSISKLQKLQTIVHHDLLRALDRNYPLLPKEIWGMPNLRHLYLKPAGYLSHPFGFRLPRKSFILQHLQTLMGIRNFTWSKEITQRIPNVKKLGIWYDVSSSVDWSTIYQLESLVDLHQLETLKITIKYHDHPRSAIPHDPPKLVFPQKLKKLTLSGCRIPWASITMIGALPNLEALKLRRKACSGPSWETVEGEFPRLIFLLLEEMHFRRWETEAAHFPRLQRLVIRSCGVLEEIPSAVGDIPTLEMMELDDCLPSAVDSAKHIQEEQESMGNVDLIVRIGLKMHIP